jgi:hypothetical protein
MAVPEIGSSPPCPKQMVKARKKTNGERRRSRTVSLDIFY